MYLQHTFFICRLWQVTVQKRLENSITSKRWRIMDWGHLAPFYVVFPPYLDGRQSARGRWGNNGNNPRVVSGNNKTTRWKQRSQRSQHAGCDRCDRCDRCFFFVSCFLAPPKHPPPLMISIRLPFAIDGFERRAEYRSSSSPIVWERSWLCCCGQVAIRGRFSIVFGRRFFRRFLPNPWCIIDVASSKEGQEIIAEDHRPNHSTLIWL